MHFDWPINNGDFLSQNEQSVEVEKITFQIQYNVILQNPSYN